MGFGNWMMKRGALGQATKLMAKMYINSKLKEPDKPDFYHLIVVLFQRWGFVPLPGYVEKFRSVLRVLRVRALQGEKVGLADIIFVVIGNESDIVGIEKDVVLMIFDILRSEGIPERIARGAIVDKNTLEAVLTEFSTI